MELQTCSKCKVEKPFSEYYKQPANKNGFQKACKECHNKERRDRYRKQDPIEKQIRIMAVGIMDRTSGRTNRRQYFDKGIQCRIGKNRTEVANYLREHFAEDIQAMLDRGERVSIDRINSAGHYEHGNLRIMEFKENSARGGKTTQKLHGHSFLVKDLETGKTTKTASLRATSRAIGCSCPAIDLYFKRNGSTPIFGRYEIKRESE